MASSGDVQVVPVPAVEPACHGGSGSTETRMKDEGSFMMMTVLDEKRQDTAPGPDFHEGAAAPELHHLHYEDDDEAALDPDDATAPETFLHDAAAPEHDLLDGHAAAPEHHAAAHASTSEEPAEETKAPVLANKDDEEAAEHNNNQAPAGEDDDHHEEADCSTRERLKRHRQEVAGRVWVPDMWGQEKLLKDWVDCAVFDRPLVPAGLLTARRALVAESCTRRPDRTTTTVSSAAGSSPLRLQNGCS